MRFASLPFSGLSVEPPRSVSRLLTYRLRRGWAQRSALLASWVIVASFAPLYFAVGAVTELAAFVARALGMASWYVSALVVWDLAGQSTRGLPEELRGLFAMRGVPASALDWGSGALMGRRLFSLLLPPGVALPLLLLLLSPHLISTAAVAFLVLWTTVYAAGLAAALSLTHLLVLRWWPRRPRAGMAFLVLVPFALHVIWDRVPSVPSLAWRWLELGVRLCGRLG